jgi:hypothetical protein
MRAERDAAFNGRSAFVAGMVHVDTDYRRDQMEMAARAAIPGPVTERRKSSDGFLLTSGANVNERQARAFASGFNGDNVLVIALTNLQFDRRSVIS